MYEYVSPESVGISSESIKKYVGILEKNHLSTHNIIMMRHGKVFYENYWKPFNKDFLHRMYSITKSFVGIAVGFMEQDGLIDLDAPMVSYLDESISASSFDNIKKQTIRNMLMMSTGCTSNTHLWFERKGIRLNDYFECATPEKGGTSKMPGAFFEYDSAGSFVLGCIVEKITGKRLLEYLREKFLDKIGFSKDAYIMTCPGGQSWADSALMCKPSDLAMVCQFMLNEGSWNGEQLLNRKYAKEAISNLISTNEIGHLMASSLGYGYQIWQTHHNSFMFYGMGSQYAVGVPDKDIVFVINSDNQAHPGAEYIILDRFFEEIVENASDVSLPDDPDGYEELIKYSESLELFCLGKGCKDNIASRINGTEYIMSDNPMGITRMKFTFADNEGIWEYTNAQGNKKLHFGFGKNIFSKFPQEGYADTVAATYVKGNFYDCASSATWTHSNNMELLVQIIDKYFGRLHMRVAFADKNTVAIHMFKIAEDFLHTYEGYAEGKANRDGFRN